MRHEERARGWVGASDPLRRILAGIGVPWRHGAEAGWGPAQLQCPPTPGSQGRHHGGHSQAGEGLGLTLGHPGEV